MSAPGPSPTRTPWATRAAPAAGDVQVMSAGTGVRHSEFNLEDETTTLFQIWIEADKRGAKPAWGAKAFPKSDRTGQFSVLASGDTTDEALTINADAKVLGATLKAGESLTYSLAAGPPRLSGACCRRGRGQRRRPERPRRRSHRGRAEITITARADAELVMVDSL